MDLYSATAEALARWEPRFKLTRVRIASATVGDTSKCPKRDFLRQMTQTLTKSCVEVALANAGS